MTFEDILDQAIAMLQRRGRLTYGALKRQFHLDDAYLEDVKAELIEGQRVAVDEDGRVLVWTGAAASAAAPAPVQAPAPLAYTPPYLAEKILTSRRGLEGERKQVTVLFADLKGSMELLADRDPEEARQLLDPVLERMMAAVHRYEGTVNQVLGDGIMALFGAPIAHEDHAIRACYAALAMQEAMRRYSDEVRRAQGMTVQMRVGLNSGEVVVRAIDSDLHMDYSAIGQTTHLAARMEHLAPPGSILLTVATLHLVEGLVRVTALGPVPVKGLSEPVEIFELLGASALRSRFQARVAGGLTRFVGRDQELEALQQALRIAGDGHGQMVALVGEAGVGKSRLVYEFTHSHRIQGWRVLESAAVSYGKATPYCPLIDLLKRYGHVEDHDDARTIRAKVTGHILTLDETLQECLPALLALLDVLPEESSFLRLDPPQRRQRTLDALTRVLLRESQVQPLLLVCEDLHWIDAETQTLLDRLVASLPTARLLLLVNYRPEYQHGWSNKTFYTQLRLDALPLASADALLHALVGDDPSLAPLKQLLIARTAGNPFFLEESVRTLLEMGVLVGAQGAVRLAQALPTIQVPATVQVVLASRIDRLPPEEKRLLQSAAVIGMEVPGPLLQAIAALPEDTLQRGLAHLQAAEFLYETRLFPTREYTFKHALTHEVTYSSLLQERRRDLHARIARALKALAGDRVVEQVERLAHHAVRGEMWAKALGYCRQAGDKAMARSAYREAMAYFEQALTVLRHLPETRETCAQAIDLRFALRSALLPLCETRRILEVLHEAETLAESLADPQRLGRVSLFLVLSHFYMAAYEQAIAACQRTLVLAMVSGDVVQQALAHRYLGAVFYYQGDYRRAIESGGQAIAFFDGARRYEHFGMIPLPAVDSRTWLALCHAELGMFAEWQALGDEGLQIAERAAHPASLVSALWAVGLLHLRQGSVARALACLERAESLVQEGDFPIYVPRVGAALGTVYVLTGRVADAVRCLTQAVERALTTELAVYQVSCQLALSEAYMLAGRLEDAYPLAERTLALARARQERGHAAYALRLLGEVVAHHDPPERARAEAHYHQALALADELGMRPLVAHCHRGLGLLYVQTDRPEQARAALTASRALYQAMEMAFWLPEVEVALAQVESRTER